MRSLGALGLRDIAKLRLYNPGAGKPTVTSKAPGSKPFRSIDCVPLAAAKPPCDRPTPSTISMLPLVMRHVSPESPTNEVPTGTSAGASKPAVGSPKTTHSPLKFGKFSTVNSGSSKPSENIVVPAEAAWELIKRETKSNLR